jgi:hypothetical protein
VAGQTKVFSKPLNKFTLDQKHLRASRDLRIYTAAFPDGAQPVHIFTDRSAVARSVRELW